MDELDLMLLELKDTSELMIDLAYSSLLYNNREIAEEVFQMEEALDEMATEIQKKAIERAVKDADPDKAFAVIRLAQSVEEISDAARQIADVVMRDNEPHPVIALSLQESESIISSATVLENSDLARLHPGGHEAGQPVRHVGGGDQEGAQIHLRAGQDNSGIRRGPSVRARSAGWGIVFPGHSYRGVSHRGSLIGPQKYNI